MKKRIFSLLLALCLVAGMLPTVAYAAEPSGKMLTKAVLESNYKVPSQFGAYYSLPSGHYYLDEDISVDTAIWIGDGINAADVILDLKGYELKNDTNSYSLILIGCSTNGSTATLTLMDSSSAKTGKVISSSGDAITFDVNGKLNANGGTVEGNVCPNGSNAEIDNTDPLNVTVFRDGKIYGYNSSAVINGGVFYSTVDGYPGKITGGIFYGEVKSNGTINGGIFYGEVKSNGTINGGIFYDTVTNNYEITGGTFYGGISGDGAISNPYHTVSFDLNGASGTTPVTQYFVNTNTAQALEPAAPTREDYEFAGWYNGETKYDFTQNVTEDITLTAKWENPEAPVITGLEDGKTYCDTVQFEVSDNVGVASITANGVTLTPDANNKYTLEKGTGTGTVTVVAIDKANNQTSVTVTVNNGHTAGNDDGDCSTPVYCIYHPDTVVVAAKSHNFSGEWNKDEDGHWHICQNDGCTVPDTKTPHSGTDDGDCTTAVVCECGYIITAANADHSYSEWEYNSTQHWRVCTVCPAEIDRADHTFSGNTCTVCGYTKPVIPTYPPIVLDTENGTVTVSPTNPTAGSKVTITATPDAGYAVDQVIVTDKNGKPVEFTDNGDGTYSFTQPTGKVTIKVVFRDATVVPFVDVPADEYYYSAVQWAVKNGITYGTSDTTFSPYAPCTRAQIVTFLWRAAGCPTPKSSEMPFTDVVKGSYYETAVLWAVENGITNGTSATIFSPDATCSRAQFATFLWRAQGKPAPGTANPFTDVEEGTYYTEAVLWAAENGITEGTSATTFSPYDDCTRAQTVTFLYRCLGK